MKSIAALCICMVMLPSVIFSKYKISGQVLDKVTNEPIPYVNVFFSNTTIGSMTNKDGTFTIDKIPNGFYKLVIQDIAHQIITKPIQFPLPNNQQPDFTFYLTPRIIHMDSVLVEAKEPKLWKKLYKRFEKEFLGTTRYASGCKILNPEVLDFEKVPESDGYCAHSDSILIVENRYLGYKVFIYLEYFKWSKSTHETVSFYPTNASASSLIKNGGNRFYCIYKVNSFFKELEPHNNEEFLKWRENRQKLYKGSLRHFFSLLASGKSDKNFSLSSYPLGTVEKENKLTRIKLNFLKSISFKDLKVTPVYDKNRLHFEDYLRISYTQDHHFVSYLKLESQYVDIDSLGNYHSPLPVTLSGYWGRLRMAGLLPEDYYAE